MKQLSRVNVLAVVLTFFCMLGASCGKDDGPEPPKNNIVQQPEEQPTEEPQEEAIDPKELVTEDGMVFMVTNNPGIPYIMHHIDGAKTSMVDHDYDGLFDAMVYSENGIGIVYELDPITGLPRALYSPEGIVLYTYKEENTLVDLAFLQHDSSIEYIRDLEIENVGMASKSHSTPSSKLACDLAPILSFTQGTGFTWALGGLCRVRNEGNIVYQNWDIPREACKSVYQNYSNCCQISLNEPKICQQLEKQNLALSLFADYTECLALNKLDDCVSQAVDEVNHHLDNAGELRSAIGENQVAAAYGALISGFGDIKVTLTWNTDSDIDLWVTEPDGNLIYWEAPESSNGGILDFDDTDGFGPENIFWSENPLPGEYRVQVHYYGDYGAGSTDYVVQLEVAGNVQSFEGTLSAMDQLNDIANFSYAVAGKGSTVRKSLKSGIQSVRSKKNFSGVR